MNKSLTLIVIARFLVVGLNVSADEPVSFRQDIAPILINNCLACHGPKKAEGSYRIDSYERALTDGDTGTPGFVTGELDGSEVYRRIISDDADERMPLDGDPLPAEQIALVTRWIEEGAKYDADDPNATLASIVPPPVYPGGPEVYPNTLPITSLAFSADGQQLFAGGYHEITVWNPADGKLVRRISNVGERTYALTLSPDGQTLAVACGQPGRLGEVRLFNPADGQLIKVLSTTSDVFFDVAYSPSGDRLAAASADGVLRVFDVASGEAQLTITSHSDWVMAVAWSADGSKLASASRDKTAKVFDAKTGDLVVTFSDHGQPVFGVAFHPDGKEVISSAADKKVLQWKIEDGKKSADVGSFGGEVYKLTSGGEFVFVGSADKSARQYEIKTRKQIHAFAGHKDWVLSTAAHLGTKRMATGCFDGEVRIWNTEDGKPVVDFLAAPGFQKPAS